MKTLHSISTGDPAGIPAVASRIATQPLPGGLRFVARDLWLSYGIANDCKACGEPNRHTGSVPLL